MPSPQTAYELVVDSMRLVNIIGPGETPTADEGNDGLRALNDLLEMWSLENLALYGQVNSAFPTVINQSIYTIGPTGNWVGPRPIKINSAYCTYQGTDTPIDVIGQDQYNAIAVKSDSSPIPYSLLYVNDDPLGRITLWPVPSAVVTITLSIDRVLTVIPSLATTITYPKGYSIALKYALAELLAPDYGREVSNSVAMVAVKSFADLKRANKVRRIASFDAGIGDSWGGNG